MPGGRVQETVTHVRLNNLPLDESLTFDSLYEARRYVTGADNTKGTPYNGQIISVNNICGSGNICGTFKLENKSTTASTSITFNNGKFRLTLIEIKRLDTGDIITPQDFVITKVSNKYWLLVFRQSIMDSAGNVLGASKSAFTSLDDVLLINDDFEFSMLGLVDIFRNNDAKLVAKYFADGSESVSNTYDKLIAANELITSVSNPSTMITTNGGVMSISGTTINHNGTSGSTNRVSEVYLDITDYLSGSVVK